MIYLEVAVDIIVGSIFGQSETILVYYNDDKLLLLSDGLTRPITLNHLVTQHCM